VKIRGGWTRSLYQLLLNLYLRPNLINKFDGHPLRGYWARWIDKRRKGRKKVHGLNLRPPRLTSSGLKRLKWQKTKTTDYRLLQTVPYVIFAHEWLTCLALYLYEFTPAPTNSSNSRVFADTYDVGAITMRWLNPSNDAVAAVSAAESTESVHSVQVIAGLTQHDVHKLLQQISGWEAESMGMDDDDILCAVRRWWGRLRGISHRCCETSTRDLCMQYCTWCSIHTTVQASR